MTPVRRPHQLDYPPHLIPWSRRRRISPWLPYLGRGLTSTAAPRSASNQPPNQPTNQPTNAARRRTPEELADGGRSRRDERLEAARMERAAREMEEVTFRPHYATRDAYTHVSPAERHRRL
jgi:hypothetical protein